MSDVPVPYDAGEDFDAGDSGPVVVPDGTDAILFAQLLVDLRDAGFPAGCPTPCDADCTARCHEAHVPRADRAHDVDDCASGALLGEAP